MSSPSSASSNKRKRGTAAERLKASSAVELQQASSRDASGEEMATSAPAANTRHRKQLSQDQTAAPPSKRARTRSSASAGVPAVITQDADGEVRDPGEPPSTTEDSVKTESKSKRRSSRATSTNSHKVGNGDAEEERELDATERRMDAPPRAGQRDPIGGYKTNPPPTGRAVRVYADGVFDLFHLGYVSPTRATSAALTHGPATCANSSKPNPRSQTPT